MKNKKQKKNIYIHLFRLIIKNPKVTFKIIIFDILFLVSIQLFYLFSDYIINNNFSISSAIKISILLLFLIIYVFGFVLIYSFFKFRVLNLVRSIFINKKNKTKFLKFYKLNLFIFIILISTFLLINLIVYNSTKLQFQRYTLIIINIIFFIIMYIIINFIHSNFLELNKIKNLTLITKGLKSTISVQKYYGIIILNIIYLIITSLILYFTGMIVNNTIFNEGVTPTALNIYNGTISIISGLIIYFIFFYNRLYFYHKVLKK